MDYQTKINDRLWEIYKKSKKDRIEEEYYPEDGTMLFPDSEPDSKGLVDKAIKHINNQYRDDEYAQDDPEFEVKDEIKND